MIYCYSHYHIPMIYISVQPILRHYAIHRYTIYKVIQRAIPCPTPDMPPMPYKNCPAAIQDLPPGPLTMFVDGSWKDEGNGIENVFLPPHIPSPSQQGGASIVFMADNPE